MGKGLNDGLEFLKDVVDNKVRLAIDPLESLPNIINSKVLFDLRKRPEHQRIISLLKNYAIVIKGQIEEEYIIKGKIEEKYK